MVDSRDYDQSSSTLRKAKKPRIPKRGPGVAELEKILREQEQRDNVHHRDNKSSIFRDPREHTAGVSFPMLASNGSDHAKMMDFFKSSSTPSSTSGVYNHHVEPPSNQKHYASTLWHEEYDKMMGTKRSRPNLPVENWRSATPTRMPYQPIRPQVSRLDFSSSSTNNGVFNLEISRDPLDHGNPSGNGSRNLISLGSPTTPLPSTLNCQPGLSKFIKQFPFQENTEGSLLQRSSTEPEVSVHNKSFVSFLLQPEELQRGNAAEATLCLKNEKCVADKTGDFIDLNLKL